MGVRYFTAASLLAISAVSVSGAAQAQERRHSQPAMPLGQALQRIAAEWAKPIDIDPDAVRGIMAKPVIDAESEQDAVTQATGGLPVAVMVNASGKISVLNDIVVTARPNEAETSVIVRGATSSSRLDQSLRDQPRNTQVISAKLMQQQQVQTIAEALANAGGVVVNTATVQGGVGYSVRGFASQGSVNGLPSASSDSFAAGTTQSLANVERIEVLKGPDAILLGGDNLGGMINIVTKKPNADERLYVSMDTGSFGLIRGTIDANRAISDDRRFSARVIATAATADRNFGGYRGDEDYLFAPSLRYKNETTDIILSATLGTQTFGMVPYTLFNTTTNQPLDLPRDRRLVGGPDQGVRIGTTQFNGEITQKLTNWLSVVGRYQYQKVTFSLRQYTPFALLDNKSLLLLNSDGVNQRSTGKSLDTFARITFNTGSVTHKIVAGYTDVSQDRLALYPSDGGFFPYDFLQQPPANLPPLASRFDAETSRIDLHQRGYYGQYLIGFGPIHLSAGWRHTDLDLNGAITGPFPSTTNNKVGSAVPNYGAVVDVAKNFSVFGTLAYGYDPTTVLDRLGNRLPDQHTRNIESGVKWDLFGKRMLINASWFSLRQSNIFDRDPVDPAFQIAVPGQLGEGIDINVSGEPLRGLTLTGAFTRTEYSLLEPSERIGFVVQAQPRDIYNLYASYLHRIGDTTRAGLGAGIAGRSSSVIDSDGRYTIPAAWQANLNGFLSVGRLDVNIGVRNLFDRKNYNPTRATTYVPLGEPRSWRLTLGYRFY